MEVYGADALDEFLIALWSEIRREVISPSNEDLELAALSALSAVVHTLSLQVTQYFSKVMISC